MKMTRRHMLGGLAAIIAAQKCPATVIKKLVGGSATALAEDSSLDVPSAAEYVHDGLVAMFDGIENFAYGMHHSGATSWRDLVGGLMLVNDHGSNYAFQSNCLYVNDDTGFRCIHGFETFGTVETVIRVDKFKDFNDFVAICGTESGKSISGCRGGHNYSYEKSIVCHSDGRGRDRNPPDGYFCMPGIPMSLSAPADNTSQIYKDNSPILCYTSSWSNAYFTKGEILINKRYINWITTGAIYSIRLYSRELSDEERAYNYFLDKERFGV